MDIGSNYEKIKQDLVERIRQNTVEVTVKESYIDNCGLSQTCYFCLKPITKDVYRLQVTDKDKLSYYNIDSTCFHDAWGLL